MLVMVIAAELLLWLNGTLLKNTIRSLESGRIKTHHEMRVAGILEDNLACRNDFGELYLNQDDS